jgi:hypothetical protein
METVEGLLYFSSDGKLLLNEDYHSHPQSRLLLERFMEVLDPNGNVLFRNEKLKGLALGGPPLPQESMVRHFAQRGQLADGTRWRESNQMHDDPGIPIPPSCVRRFVRSMISSKFRPNAVSVCE